MNEKNQHTSRENTPTPSVNGEETGIFVDPEGGWFYGERPIFRKEILETFFASLRLLDDGRYVLEWQGRLYPIAVADTPFVITRVDRITNGAEETHILLTFKHLEGTEPLDPSTLWVGRDNVLYCRVRHGRFPARFSRPAYYQVAQWIEPLDNDRFALRLGDRLYPIAQTTEHDAAFRKDGAT